MRIFRCKKCGKIVIVVKDSASNLVCCGDEMSELVANTVDAAVEKHVPVIKEDGEDIIVTCGEVLHPMEENHYIEFMIIETDRGYSIKYLNPGEEPSCAFKMSNNEKLIAVYAYCNLHGLWVNNK